jgi:hypothetical protein
MPYAPGAAPADAAATRRKSVNDHWFPMPHLSRRGDKRVEMGHRPQGAEALSSYHILTVILSVGQHGGRVRTYGRTYGRADRHTYGQTDVCMDRWMYVWTDGLNIHM